jgi:hypothetical protein
MRAILSFLYFCSFTAHAAITIVEPTEEDRKLQEFSFDPTESFLEKKNADTISYILEITDHDPSFPVFQVKNLSTDKKEHAFIEFSHDSDTPATTYRTTQTSETFKVTLTFSNLETDIAPATQTSRKRVDLEFGFHSDEAADDAKSTAKATFFIDHSVPGTKPAKETITPGDEIITVEIKNIPSEVRYLMLVYTPESASTTDLTLTPEHILVRATLESFNLCFQAIDVSATQTTGSYKFDGKNKIGSFRCAENITNDIPYIVSVAWADTAGNLTFSETSHHNVTPRILTGAFDPDQISCVSAGVNPSSDKPFGWLLLGLILIAFFARQSLLRRRFSLRILFLFFLLSSSVPLTLHAQLLYDKSGDLIQDPSFGFIELMYGYFPVPTLNSGVSYDFIFEPDSINLSRGGPPSILIGSQWQWLRIPMFEAGPFARLGFGTQTGQPYFVAGGIAETTTADEVKLLILPFQAGGGANLFLMNRLISLNGRLGVQYSLFNQSFGSQKSGGAWFGNFSTFLEFNSKFNLDWLEAWAAWGLFDDWGILNTYLSAHLFYFTNLTGNQLTFSSNSAGNTFQQNLGWFLGVTFEI